MAGLRRQQETAALGGAIAELASRIQAATYELLVMIHQFDEREGWGQGFTSCAHWLNWRTGLAMGAAREKVRVARALAELPRLSADMRRGALSYSKARALTRIATPDNEISLAEFARSATAAHVERLVRAWRRVDRLDKAEDEKRRHASRHLDIWTDEDGMLVVRGRLSPEVGAVVRRALEAAADRLYRSADNTTGAPNTGPEPDAVTGAAATPAEQDSTACASAGQRRADALGLMAESALAADLDGGTAGDRYQVVVHVDPQALTAPLAGADQSCTDPASLALAAASRAGARHHHNSTPVSQGSAGGQAALEDGVCVPAETARRVACDASRVVMRHDRDGTVLDVGRKTRTIPPAIRRALTARDNRCRFPGCDCRHCDAHHVQHWADGGATRLNNLLMLCRRHHRAVHEQGFRVELRDGGDARFFWPDGRPFSEAPPALRWAGPALGPCAHLAAAGITIDGDTATPDWYGERLDLDWAILVLRPPAPSVRLGIDVPAETHWSGSWEPTSAGLT